jgi:hypothetical protein
LQPATAAAKKPVVATAGSPDHAAAGYKPALLFLDLYSTVAPRKPSAQEFSRRLSAFPHRLRLI